MTALFASEDYAKLAFVFLIPLAIGVPCVLFGGLMTLSGLYEERQAVRDNRHPLNSK